MTDNMSIILGIYISSSILIIITNLSIISVILYSSNLRSMIRCKLIVGIALADLLLGCFVAPLYIRAHVESSFPLCHTQLAVQVIGDHGVYFVVGWTLFTFNVLYIKKMCTHFSWKWPSFPALISPWVKGMALALWPWIAAMCTLVPLVLSNSNTKIHNGFEDIMCMLSMSQSIVITASFLSLYLPFYLCVAALVTLVVCYSKGCHREAPTTLMEEAHANPSENLTQPNRVVDRHPPENPLWASVPSTVYLVCYMPLIVHTWLEISNILPPYPVYVVIIFGCLARSFLLPLSWLVFQDINAEVKDYWKKLRSNFNLCLSNPPPSTSSSVSFSRLQELQTV